MAWYFSHHKSKEGSNANHDAISYTLAQYEDSILIGHIEYSASLRRAPDRNREYLIEKRTL